VAPITVVVAVAAVHVWLSSYMRAPIVQADEFGYLYGAHFLALGGPSPVTSTCSTICSSSPYYPGYSLLLAPLWLIWQTTSTVYHAALDVNTALAALTAWLVYVLAGRLAPNIAPWSRALVALVVAAYPSYLLYGNLLESENLLIPAWLGTCILANRAFTRRGAGQRANPTWVALGLAGGLLYMVHPSALAAATGVAAVGTWVAISPRNRPWALSTSLACLASLVLGLLGGLVASRVVITQVNAGAPSNSAGFVSAIGHLSSLHGVAHLGVNTSGQLLYLLAVTGGLVVLAVGPLTRGRFGERPCPSAATLRLIGVTSLVMLAVSVLSLGTGGVGRLDLTLYGRYNEAVLAPVLVIGALAGLRIRRRHLRTWALPGGLGALALTAGAVAAARGAVLHGTPQATNILAAHAVFRAAVHSSLNLVLLAGLGAAVLVVSFLAWRLNVALAAAIIVATFVPSAAAGLSDLSGQSGRVAAEQSIPDALAALGPKGGCVSFDTAGAPDDAGFAFFDFRLYDPTQRFEPFDSAAGGRPCSDEVVSGRTDLGSSLAGAREVVADPRAGEALWVLPGPLEERLAAEGRIRPAAQLS
jgi:hypothetical protein